MKKVFYVSLCVFILVGIFLVAYNFVFRHNVTDPIADPSKVPVAEEDAKVQKIAALAPVLNEEVLGASVGNDGHLYYFSLTDKTLKKATLEGKNKTVLLSNLPGFIDRLVWAPQKDKVLVLIRNSTGTSIWHMADLTTKTLVPLRPEMSRLTWNNLGDKIFYLFTDPKSGERSLNTASPDGSNWKELTRLGKNDFYISAIPKSTFVSFWSRPNALEETTFETIGLSGENRKQLLADKKGADYLWSPTGKSVVVSSSGEPEGLMLSSMNASGGELRSLSIPTLVSKVVWNKGSDTIYYALPGNLPSASLLPNDYWSQPLYTQDTFWKMDLSTGKKTRLVDLEDLTESFDSMDLVLSPNEDILFFTDRKTRKLYRIDL